MYHKQTSKLVNIISLIPSLSSSATGVMVVSVKEAAAVAVATGVVETEVVDDVQGCNVVAIPLVTAAVMN